MKSNSKGFHQRGQAGELRFRQWVVIVMLGVLVPAAIGILIAGCQKNVPPASVMAVPPCGQPYSFNNCQSLTAQGTWNPTAQGPYISSVSLSNFYATFGTFSLDVDVTGPSTGYITFAKLNGFTPVAWENYPEMIFDLTVDPSIVKGSTYSSLLLIGSNGTSYGGYSTMSANSPTVSAGYQSVTFDIDLSNSASQIPVTLGSTINLLYFIYNRNSPSGPGQETGNMYVDNIRLIPSCP